MIIIYMFVLELFFLCIFAAERVWGADVPLGCRGTVRRPKPNRNLTETQRELSARCHGVGYYLYAGIELAARVEGCGGAGRG